MGLIATSFTFAAYCRCRGLSSSSLVLLVERQVGVVEMYYFPVAAY